MARTFLDRETMRALVLAVSEKMDRERWEQSRRPPATEIKDTGLSARDEAILDALCELGDATPSVICDLLVKWLPEQAKEYNSIGVGRTLNRLVTLGLVEMKWHRHLKQAWRVYQLTDEGRTMATTPNSKVWEAS